jgi:putative flippase GtrA
MFAKIITQISQRRQFVIYACIGLVGVSLDLTSFAVFDRLLGWHYQFANVVSTSLGVLLNFLLNVRFNFKVRDRLLVRFGSFYAVGLTGMGATALLLALFVGWLAMPAVPVKSGTLVIVLLLQYNLNRWLTFRKNPVPVDSVS